MNYREGEFAFGNVLAETFIIGILGILKILEIISNLKEDSNQVDQGNVITNVSSQLWDADTLCWNYMPA